MKTIVCRYCHATVNVKRSSKHVCDNSECKNKYHQEYYKNNPDKADLNRFNASNRNRKMSSRKWNQINREIHKDTEPKTDPKYHICDDCGTKYMSSQGYNATPWNTGVCPVCGLVEWSLIDLNPWFYHIKYHIQPAKHAQIQEWRAELRKVSRMPIARKCAIYIGDKKQQIDFISELKDLRRLLNNLRCNNKRKGYAILTTPQEEQICFEALNSNIKNKNKVIKTKR